MLALIMIWLISQCHPCSIFQKYLSGQLEMTLGIQSMSVLQEYLADLFCKMEFLECLLFGQTNTQDTLLVI